MKTPKKISEGLNHSAIDLGSFDDLMNFSYIHPKFQNEVKGKLFVGELLKSSGSEISFQFIEPFKEIPFLHQHKNNEEIYVILKGSGQFQVDEISFDVSEGSLIRINPNGKRTYRNNSSNPMIVMCIQSKERSIESYNVQDGFRSPGKPQWK
jgi:mannose-6-phosphate isomerase-like protein (cupin superfamily)